MLGLHLFTGLQFGLLNITSRFLQANVQYPQSPVASIPALRFSQGDPTCPAKNERFSKVVLVNSPGIQFFQWSKLGFIPSILVQMEVS